MGIISRRVLPVCGSLCICCPELRARSRQPVKRYKKLLTDIFPKNQEEAPNDRKIGKLTEYASRNPLRIPKIASSLEQRGYKELRSERFGSVRVVVRAYSRLLVDCRDQMPLFATSVLGMIRALLEQARHDDLQILGCLTLVDFLQNQTDSTYMRNLDAYLPKLCALARKKDEEAKYIPLCAAALQALASMISFMGKYSQISSEFKDIVEVVLVNYGSDISDMEADIQERGGDPGLNWLHGALTKLYSAKETTRFKDPANLNRKEMQLPKVWSQICVQNLARLSKEATTVRRILDPIFDYFDKHKKWSESLSVAVLHHMQYFMEKSGNEQLFLPMLVRHLDHKAVAEKPATKANIVEIIGNLARHSKSKPTIVDVGVMSDLLKHLGKSIQFTLATSKPFGLVDDHMTLQSALEDCLKELMKRVGETGPVLDMMASNLEKLSATPSTAKSTLDALFILSQCVMAADDQSGADQLFPEALLQQLLKAMMHPGIEVRLRAHELLSLLLTQSPKTTGLVDLDSTQTKPESSNMLSRTSSAFSSLFEKLRKDNQGGEREIQTESCTSMDERDESIHDMRESIELKKMGSLRSSDEIGGGYLSPIRLFGALRPSVDRSESSPRRSASVIRRWPVKELKDFEMTTVKLSGHQAALLLSVLWLEASLPDNLPSNFEAIAHTYMVTLLFSRPKTSAHSTITRAFQLAFSLRRLALDLDGNATYIGSVQLPPSRRRSLFMLATAMLVTAGHVYGIHQIIPLAKAPLIDTVKDPYLELLEELRLKVVSSAHLKSYGSAVDDNDALVALSRVMLSSDQTPEALAARIVECSPILAESENSPVNQMLQQFVAEEDEVLGPYRFFDRSESHDSAGERADYLSFDETISGTGPALEDDLASDNSGAELPRLLARVSVSALPQHAIGVSQLLEAALQTAGQVASVTFTENRLSYTDMASKCEAFSVDNRKKISCVLRLEAESTSMRLTLPEKNWPSHTSGKDELRLEDSAKDSEESSTPLLKHSVLREISFSPSWLTQTTPEPWQLFRLPPASPYDNFLKAACY